MGLGDRLRIPAAKNSRRRPLGRSDLGHPVTMTTDFAKVSQTQKFRSDVTSRLLELRGDIWHEFPPHECAKSEIPRIVKSSIFIDVLASEHACEA